MFECVKIEIPNVRWPFGYNKVGPWDGASGRPFRSRHPLGTGCCCLEVGEGGVESWSELRPGFSASSVGSQGEEGGPARKTEEGPRRPEDGWGHGGRGHGACGRGAIFRLLLNIVWL